MLAGIKCSVFSEGIFMAHPLVHGNDRIEVHPHAVSIGKYLIPCGVMRCVSINSNTKEVRVWCRGGAMGHIGEVILDFHLLTPNRVKTFVQGLLNRTGVYLVSIYQLTTRVLRNGGGASIQAEFVFSEWEMAQRFYDHAAPVYFPGILPTLNGRTVTIITKPTDETDAVYRVRQVFSDLNAHTGNTLQEALSRDPLAPFQIDPLPPFIFDNACPFRQSPHYAISPTGVRKEASERSGHPEFAPLTFNPAIADSYWKRLLALEKKIDQLKRASPKFEHRYRFLIDLIKEAIAQFRVLDEVKFETVQNRFRSFLETAGDSLDPEIRRSIEELFT